MYVHTKDGANPVNNTESSSIAVVDLVFSILTDQ